MPANGIRKSSSSNEPLPPSGAIPKSRSKNPYMWIILVEVLNVIYGTCKNKRFYHGGTKVSRSRPVFAPVRAL